MDNERSELYAMESAEQALKMLKYIEMEIHNKIADNQVNKILKEFYKFIKILKADDYPKIGYFCEK